jgi:hypothetical protein
MLRVYKYVYKKHTWEMTRQHITVPHSICKHTPRRHSLSRLPRLASAVAFESSWLYHVGGHRTLHLLPLRID